MAKPKAKIAIVDIEDVVVQKLIEMLSNKNLLQAAAVTDPGQIRAFTSGNQVFLKRIFSNFMEINPPILKLEK